MVPTLPWRNRLFGGHADSRVRAERSTSVALMAHAGAIPAGGNDFDPAQHAVHTLVAVDEGSGHWRITLFQSTPAVWTDHPGQRDALTEELRGVLTPR